MTTDLQQTRNFLDALVFCDLCGAIPQEEPERRMFLHAFLKQDGEVTPEQSRCAALYVMAKMRLEELPPEATDQVRIAALGELLLAVAGELPA